MLGLYHLNVDDVELVYLAPNEMANALDNDNISAAAIWEPYAFEIKKKLGAEVIILDTDSLYTLYFNLVARQSFANSNHETNKKLLQSLNQAIGYGQIIFIICR